MSVVNGAGGAEAVPLFLRAKKPSSFYNVGVFLKIKNNLDPNWAIVELVNHLRRRGKFDLLVEVVNRERDGILDTYRER